MIIATFVLLTQQTLLATAGVGPSPDVSGLTMRRAVVAVGRCADPWGSSAPLTGKPRAVHPDRLRERFGRSIAAKDWATVFAGYAAVIDTTLDQVGGQPSADFDRLRQAFRIATDSTAVGLARALQRPRSELAAGLSELDINQFRPVTNMNGALVILQGNRIPLGVPLDSTKLSSDQFEAICWSGWSLHRLLANINFETIPGALARIEAQERRWERYRTQGPMQLPHEMMLNRVKRFVVKPKGSSRFNPPRLDLVAVHPFAGVELMRVDDGVAPSGSVAAELAGATLWINDWKQHIGASWVLAYDTDGRTGYGALVRLGGYVTAGFVNRDDAAGKSRTSLLVNLDALRLLKPDALPQAVRQAQSIAGEVLDRLPR